MGFNPQQYNTEYLLRSRGNIEAASDTAATYGVKIVEADVAEGEVYWRVIGVHHLLPRENFGNHHVYIEALDEEGRRIQPPVAWAGWTWRGRRPDERVDPVPLDKPTTEAAGNITMHFGQVVSVWINGRARDASEKSDRVEELHTTHPDEPLPDGAILNGLGHHSFYVVFQRTRKRSQRVSVGSISGRVERGFGQIVRLMVNEEVVAEHQLGPDLVFKFENLPFRAYSLVIVDTEIRHDNIQLNISNRNIELNLALPAPTASVIFGQVTNGGGKILLLVKSGNILARVPLPQSGHYRFENLAEGVYSIQVFDTGIRQDNIALDGQNSREINLAVPLVRTVEKSINHYLLLGPPQSRGRQTNLLVSTNYILAFSVTVGFSVAEAQQARQVTVLGEAASAAELEEIRSSGSEVEKLTGDAYELEATLAERVRAGRAFGS